MQLIQPNSEEARALKAKAIVNRDYPLLEQLQEVEGKEFFYCETVLDLIQVSSIEGNEIVAIEATELREAFKSVIEGGV
jgi:hypothetical protein